MSTIPLPDQNPAHTLLALLDPGIRESPVYLRHAVWERLAQPACAGHFPVVWMDDHGQVRMDDVFFALPGTCTEAVVLVRTELQEDPLRGLCLLRRLQHALLGREAPALAGLRADPTRLRDGESMRLCRSLRAGLRRLIPGVRLRMSESLRERERGYLRIGPEGVITQTEAAAEGLCSLAQETLRVLLGQRPEGRSAAILGDGPLAAQTARAARRLGIIPVADAPAELVFLCSDGSPLCPADAERLVRCGARCVFEGSLGACPPDTAAHFLRYGLPLVPAVAAGAGGVLPLDTDDRWEALKLLRRGMRSLLGRVLDAGDGDPYRGTYVCALTAAADRLVRQGI